MWFTMVVFTAVATLHVLRVVLGWDLVLGNVFIPQWVSWIAVVVAGFLAHDGYKLNRTRK